MCLWGKSQHLWQQHLEAVSQHVPYQDPETEAAKQSSGITFYFNACHFPSEKYQIFPAVMKKGLSNYDTYNNCSTKQSKKKKKKRKATNQPHLPSWAWSLSGSLQELLPYTNSRQLSPSHDWSFMSRWFMVCRTAGSTFFTMFSNWWGSDFRSYTSTNDWGHRHKHFHNAAHICATGLPDTAALIPHCLQTRSTVGSGPWWGFWHRHRCCCRHLHTRSLGNIAGERMLN